MDHDLGSIRPNNNDDLEEPSRPIRPEVQRLVGVVLVVGCIESVCHGVADVVIIEPIADLVLPCRSSDFHPDYRITKLRNRPLTRAQPEPDQDKHSWALLGSNQRPLPCKRWEARRRYLRKRLLCLL